MILALSALRKSWRYPLLILAGLALSACQMGGAGGANGPRVGQNVQVAMLLPYGSPNAGDELVARSLENAARLAMTDIEGVQVQLVIYGTAADAAQAATVAQQAVSEGADIIIGPLRSDAAAAVGVAVSRNNINVLSLSNNTEIAGGNVFVLGHTYENSARRVIGYSAAQGRNRFVTLHARNLAGEIARDAVREAVESAGAVLTGEVAYEFSQAGVVGALEAVSTTVEDTQANALMVTSDATGALPLFAQLLPENGLDTEATRFIGLTRWDTPPQTLEIAGLQGGWFAIPDPNADIAFRTRYTAAYDETAHVLAPIGYDAMRAVIETAATQGRLGGAELTAGSGIQGANGVFRLRADGTNERAMAVIQVQENQMVVVDPAPRIFGSAGF